MGAIHLTTPLLCCIMIKYEYTFDTGLKLIIVNIHKDGLGKLVELLKFDEEHLQKKTDSDLIKDYNDDNYPFSIEEIEKMEECWNKTRLLLSYCINNICCNQLSSETGTIRYDKIELLRSNYGYKAVPGNTNEFGWVTATIRPIDDYGYYIGAYEFKFR